MIKSRSKIWWKVVGVAGRVFSLGILVLVFVTGCEKRSGEAVVISKEYIAAAASPADSPAPNRDEANEITVDSYVMPGGDRGTSRDPRALQHEQWLVKVQMTDNGRIFNVPADRSGFEKVKPDDRVRVRYRVGKYTGTVWAAELVND